MSEMDLGGKIELTVPQLRVYLSCLERKLKSIAADAERLDKQWVETPEADRSINEKEYNSLSNTFFWEKRGIYFARNQLLDMLNLPNDWDKRMDRKEELEVLANSPCPKIRNKTYIGCVDCKEAVCKVELMK